LVVQLQRHVTGPCRGLTEAGLDPGFLATNAKPGHATSGHASKGHAAKSVDELTIGDIRDAHVVACSRPVKTFIENGR
jgi:hypothetical protein